MRRYILFVIDKFVSIKESQIGTKNSTAMSRSAYFLDLRLRVSLRKLSFFFSMTQLSELLYIGQ